MTAVKRPRSHRINIHPVGTWVDTSTKSTMRHRWQWAGHRSEAAYLRGLIQQDLQKNPPPGTAAEGLEERVGSFKIEEQGK